jgi:hypothetical protein
MLAAIKRCYNEVIHEKKPEYRDNPVPDNCYRLPRILARINKLP